MSTIGKLERETQNRVIKIFTDELGYEYLGNWEERDNNSNVEEDLLRMAIETLRPKPDQQSHL